MAIIINTEGITDEQKATDKFKSAHADMLRQLTADGFIPVLCAHEAAHAVYFGWIGAKEFEPQPATLVYDPAIDDYRGSLASLKLLDLPTWKEGKFSEWFDKVAFAHVAGGVISRKLMPSSDGGDGDDKCRFRQLCEQLNEDPHVNIDCEKVWKAAQEAVAKHLENEAWLKQILAEAERFRPHLGL